MHENLGARALQSGAFSGRRAGIQDKIPIPEWAQCLHVSVPMVFQKLPYVCLLCG
jgi:hypothetical protein